MPAPRGAPPPRTPHIGRGNRRPITVVLTPADGRLLVEEALAQANTNSFSFELLTGSAAFAVDSPRVIVQGTAAISSRGAFRCPVTLSGRPIVADNKIALEGPDVTTEGPMCGVALTGLKSRVLDLLHAHPWDLARRLARASADPALPGPRLTTKGCRTTDQIILKRVVPRPPDLLVEIEVADVAPRGACP